MSASEHDPAKLEAVPDPNGTGGSGEAWPGPVDMEELGHPRGTLAIVMVYGALFVIGWLMLYFIEFVPRGAPQP